VSEDATPVAAADEAPHAPGPGLDWCDVYAFEVHDECCGIGGLTRMTLRPNEGAVDVALSFFLPDGGFITAHHVTALPRNPIPTALDVGGVRYAVEEPLRRWRVTYDGPAHSLASARDADRREAWARSRLERLIVDLAFEAAMPPATRGGEDGFQQVARVHGEVWVSGDRYELRALGGRERSWGVADEATWHVRRRVGARFAENLAFDVASAVSGERELAHGWLLRDSRVLGLRSLRVATTTEPGTRLPKSVRLEATDEDGGRHEIAGDVLHVAPLPTTRSGRASLLCESVVRLDWNGRTGHGFASELRRLDGAGRPVLDRG
jgi:hypothetical protein